MNEKAAAGARKGVKSLKAFLYGFILFFILTIIAVLLLRFTPLPEEGAVWYMLGALTFSCFSIGLYAGSFMKKRGLLYGALYAFAFLILILAAAGMFAGGNIKIDMAQLRYLVCVLFGSFGGMVGVNLRI